MEEWSYKVLDRFWRKVHKWRRKTLHDKILISVTVLAVFIINFSLCMLDSHNWVFVLGVAVGGCVWLLVFMLANTRNYSEIPNSRNERKIEND